MSLVKIPPSSSLQDGQFIQIQGPDGLVTGYQYDNQQRALYFKESQVLYPSFHGISHIAEDPIPSATCDTPGLMSADDKCKIDAMIQTRIGVLGFSGAGFPSDGGWMDGPIIFAAGTEFISIERVGNVIRWSCDSPIPINCNIEECETIPFIQDETDIFSVRPPCCGGKLPGVNIYGELKTYIFPESTIIDPNNAAAALNNKSNYPAFIFKRYDDSMSPGVAEHEIVLKRDSVNLSATEIGLAFTPGATGIPEMIWFMGKDDEGNQITYELEPTPEPGLLGSILYNGHLITKKMGVVTGYANTILSTNQYTVKEWDTDNKKPIGDAFTATNTWMYANPENAFTGTNPKALIYDSTVDLLPIGTLVDLWAFRIGQVSGEPILRYYFNEKPKFNPNYAWSWADHVRFGDTITARDESTPGTEGVEIGSTAVSSIRNFERSQWGLTNYDDPVYEVQRAVIDTNIPCLKVLESDRPVWLWNRKSFCNSLIRLDIGRPEISGTDPYYSVYDLVFRADIDENENKYCRVQSIGETDGLDCIQICGLNYHDLPPFGSIRVISPGSNSDIIYNYHRKSMFSTIISGTDGTVGTEPTAGYELSDCNLITLIGEEPYSGNVGDICELLHQEYDSHVVRAEFHFNPLTGLVRLQFKVGNLDVELPYDNGTNDFIRDLAPGYAVSGEYQQAGTFTGVGTQPDSTIDGFVVYDGQAVIAGTQNEFWNRLEVMIKDNQVWIWWNQLLIPPDSTLSGSLPTPVSISTPYFQTVQDADRQFGKIGLRLFEGAKVRRFDIRSQTTLFSEFTFGQLQIS